MSELTACEHCHQAIMEVTAQDAEDILISAIESGYYGSGGWTDFIDTKASRYWDFKDDGRPLWRDHGDNYPVYFRPEDEELSKPLGPTALIRGIRAAAAYYGKDVRTFIEDHDAGDADSAVQFAIFGELVYG